MAASPRIDTFAVPSPLASPGPIVAGADGDLWFIEAAGAIGRASTAGRVDEFPLPTPDGGGRPVLGGLTAGPDGAIWAVDVANNRVDRIDHSGQVKTYPLPADQVEGVASSTEPGSHGAIVAGSDGNLWVAANSRQANAPGAIDRITPGGVVAAFALPRGGGAAGELAAGPDGVWFTDPAANRVGLIDPAGQIREYGAPTPANLVDPGGMGLVVGPDGDAYYLSQDRSAIVRVDTTGTMTPVANLASFTIGGLLADPGGVDFAYSAGGDNPSNVLDHLAPDGTITPVVSALPSASGLAFGPDGNLWATQGFLGLLSRVAVAPAPVADPGPTLVLGEPVSSSDSPPVATAASVFPVGEAATIQGLALSRRSAGVAADSATIDWGDGSAPTAATLTDLASSADGSLAALGDPFVEGQVAGSHAYGKAGSYRVTITIRGTAADGSPLTASIVEPVSAVDPTPTRQPPLDVLAGRSIPFGGPVLDFATPTAHDSAGSDFAASIDWGDGSAATTGTVAGGTDQDQGGARPTFVAEGSGIPANLFQVAGGHTYASAGTFTVEVTLTDSSGRVATESTPIRVVAGRLAIAPAASPLALTADPSPDPLAFGADTIDLGTLTDFLGGDAAGADAVTVDWGDGSAPAALSIMPRVGDGLTATSGAAFDLYGTHAYAAAGSYTVRIIASDAQGDSTTATAAVRVAARTLTVQPAVPLNSWGGDLFNITGVAGASVATIPLFAISPSDPTAPPGGYAATIDWGDGSAPTAGTVESAASLPGNPANPASAGPLIVLGDHTYAGAGLYDVKIAVTDPDGTTASATATASISLAGVQGLLPVLLMPGLTAGSAGATMPLANFFAPANAPATAFRATVDWGDGSAAEAATVQPDSSLGGIGGQFQVVAGHAYAEAGTYTITTTVVGLDGLPQTLTNQLTVAPAPPAGATPVDLDPPVPPIPPVTVPAVPPMNVMPPPVPGAPAPAIPTPGSTPVATVTTTPTPVSTAPPTPAPIAAPVLAPAASSPSSTTGLPVVDPMPTFVLPHPFPRFAPGIAIHHGPARHRGRVEHPGHHAPASTSKAGPKAAHHGSAGSARAARLPRIHPSGPARPARHPR